MILIAFQDALVLSLRSQRRLEKIVEQIQDKSMLIEIIQRDFSHLVPLKDGKQIYFIDDSNSLLFRFISQKTITYPPRQSSSRILLIEYSFNRILGTKAMLTRKVQEISGYNEYTLEKELDAKYINSYLMGGVLLDYEMKAQSNLSWFEESKTLDLRWKRSKKSGEIDSYRFHFWPFNKREKKNEN